ncbi:hypothetical protein MY4824_008924 [Beauveria thailandica]
MSTTPNKPTKSTKPSANRNLQRPHTFH